MATSRNKALWSVVALASLVGAGCTKVDNTLAKVPIFAFMHDAPFFDPYEHPLPPPPGSVPFAGPGAEALPALEATVAGLEGWANSEYGVNPYTVGDPAVSAAGQVVYDRHCAVCHGAQGAGDGPLVGEGKFPVVPPVASGNALALSDGYIYAIVRAGRGLMPAYGARMSHAERWAVVNYVRTLQGGAVPAVADTARTQQ